MYSKAFRDQEDQHDNMRKKQEAFIEKSSHGVAQV